MKAKFARLLFSSCLVVFMVCCNRGEKYVKKTVSLIAYQRFEKDTNRALIELTIMKVYPAKLECVGVEKYANLYIAKRLNGQVLYVFEYCKKVSKLINDTTGRYVPLIDTSSILHDNPEKVDIFVPKDFSIPPGSKYVFANLGWLTES